MIISHLQRVIHLLCSKTCLTKLQRQRTNRIAFPPDWYVGYRLHHHVKNYNKIQNTKCGIAWDEHGNVDANPCFSFIISVESAPDADAAGDIRYWMCELNGGKKKPWLGRGNALAVSNNGGKTLVQVGYLYHHRNESFLDMSIFHMKQR